MFLAFGLIAGLVTALILSTAVERVVDRWRPVSRELLDAVRETLPSRQEGAVLHAPDEQAERVKDKVAKADAEGRDIPAEELI